MKKLVKHSGDPKIMVEFVDKIRCEDTFNYHYGIIYNGLKCLILDDDNHEKEQDDSYVLCFFGDDNGTLLKMDCERPPYTRKYEFLNSYLYDDHILYQFDTLKEMLEWVAEPLAEPEECLDND